MLQFKRKIKFEDFLFYVSFTIFLVFSCISNTFILQFIPNFVYKSVLFGSVSLILFREIYLNKYSFRSLIGSVFFALISFNMMTVTSKLNIFAIYVIFIFCLRNVEFDKIVRLTFIICSLFLCITIVASKLGIIDDYILVSYDGRIRHFLGYRYTLFAPTAFMNIISIWLYLRRERASFFSWIIIFMCNYWLYKQTDSRLTFYSSLLLILLGVLLKIYPNFLDKFKVILYPFIYIYIMCVLLSSFLVNEFKNPSNILLKINTFLGNRILYARRSLNYFGYKLFGQDIEWHGNGLDQFGNKTNHIYLYVDNFYIQVLQRYGLIFLIIFSLIMTLLLYNIYKKEKFLLFTILVLLALHALIDDLILYPQFNIFWITVGCIINKNYQFDSQNKLKLTKSKKYKFVFKKEKHNYSTSL